MKPRSNRKIRLERPRKQYALNQCALFAVRGTGQLLEVLRWVGSRDDLEALPTKNGSYATWKDGKRNIQAASQKLQRVHARIAVLLRRVMPPIYRHSGVRGRSFVTNAKQHLADYPSIKIDIKGFYPSTTFNQVRSFFMTQMRCAGDVSFLLANLCCYDQKHLPTGGIHSEVLSFFCHKAQFHQLLARGEERNGTMTVYVDDIMVTMPNASLTDLEWARKLFKRAGTKIHAGKSRVIPKRAVKKITGVVIQNGKTLAPSDQHRKVRDLHEELSTSGDLDKQKRLARSLLGHLDHIAQIDGRFQDKAKGNRARLNALVS